MKIKYNKQTKQWEKLPDGSPEGIYINPSLYEKILNIKKIQRKGWDSIILIDGARRSGKSVMGMTIGYILDPEGFTIENISAGTQDAAQKIKNLPDKSVLMVDEGSLIFSSKDVMRNEQKRLMKIIDVVGVKGLTLIVILPTFFDLARAIAITHSRFLIHIYTDKQLSRGFFGYFGQRKKRMLYEIGKKSFNSYKHPESDFTGRFTDFNPFGQAYLDLKKKSLLEALGTDVDQPFKKAIRQRDILINYLYKKRVLTQQAIGDLLGKYGVRIDKSTISKLCKALEEGG